MPQPHNLLGVMRKLSWFSFIFLGVLASITATTLPTVVWHGLGDTADSEGITDFLNLLTNHTGSPSFAISTGGRDSSFVGNINVQLATVCEELKSNSQLKDGFNAIGFSQGGQFLRAYVERCNDPPMKNLMTWGSQHSGILEVPCQSEASTLCSTTRFFVRNNAFSSFVQNKFIPAQYYKGFDLDAYLKGSIFLADVNNERSVKNPAYAANLQSLHNFVMIMFKDDLTVIPKQSSLFQEVGADGNITQIEHTTYWKDLGLDILADKDRLISLVVEGGHMEIDKDQLLSFVDAYFLDKEEESIGLSDTSKRRKKTEYL